MPHRQTDPELTQRVHPLRLHTSVRLIRHRRAQEPRRLSADRIRARVRVAARARLVRGKGGGGTFELLAEGAGGENGGERRGVRWEVRGGRGWREEGGGGGRRGRRGGRAR
jgi:hypothetical protein